MRLLAPIATTAKNYLSQSQQDALRRAWFHMQHVALSQSRRDLARIGKAFDAGKLDWFYPIYERHLGPFRGRPITLLEIGVGGYQSANSGGGSLRMWRTYFPRANIYGIDIYDKSYHDTARIKTFRGRQDDPSFLQHVLKQIGTPDVVIDDGSHVSAHVIESFRMLFPKLATNGVYVVEDTQTSYWPDYARSLGVKDDGEGSLEFFKRLSDGLNYEEWIEKDASPQPFDQSVVGLHFYHNMLVAEKGSNANGSNIRGRVVG